MQIVGHQKKRTFLAELSKMENLPQSYLLAGPRSIGKKLVALEFSQALVGNMDGPLPHPDILLLTPGEKKDDKGKRRRQKISIEEIRAVTHFLSRYPTLGRRRVAIIDGAEELSLGASNALLKILEEPNGTSVIILITHRPGQLLPTVLSRVVTVSFDLVPEGELRAFFQENRSKLPDFFFTLGLPGLIALGESDPNIFSQHREFLGKLFRVSQLPLRERIVLAEELAEDEEVLPMVLEEWLTGLHVRVEQAGRNREKQKLLLLFDRMQSEIATIVQRKGNTRLLLEKMLLSL